MLKPHDLFTLTMYLHLFAKLSHFVDAAKATSSHEPGQPFREHELRRAHSYDFAELDVHLHHGRVRRQALVWRVLAELTTLKMM